MSEPEQPADASPTASPTPEEISARLEALLKRTHAMRAQRAGAPAAHAMTWPPPDRELAHYEVVDVPEADRPVAVAATTSTPEAPETVRPPAPIPGLATDAPAAPPEFSRPDWSELRLRGTPDEVAPRRSWLPVLTVLFALAAIGQAAYLAYLMAGTPAPTDGRLRVEGPAGAEVRIDGESIGTAPVDRTLAPGSYAVAVGADSSTEATRVTIEQGAVVVLWPLTRPAPRAALPPTTAAAATDAGTSPAPPPSPGTAPRAAPTVPAPPIAPTPAASPAGDAAATGPAAVSPTRGAVAIESTPPGLPVTMEGRERGFTPITIGQLRPGRHDVLVGGLARQVDVAANQITTLRVARP